VTGDTPTIPVSRDEVIALYVFAMEGGDFDRAALWADTLLRRNDPAEKSDAEEEAADG
jgi:hypothetical protein